MRAERAAWIVAHAHPQHVRPDRKPLVMNIAPDPVEARVPIVQIAHVRSLEGPSIQFEHEHQIAVIEGDHMLIDMPRIRQEFLGHFLPLGLVKRHLLRERALTEHHDQIPFA